MENLAGRKDCDKYILAELEAAGLSPIEEQSAGEVPYHYVGKLGRWTFRRAWYYWAAGADGEGIPMDRAEILHKAHGQEVRVDGHCMCPSPSEWFKKRPVNRYHADTQEGLNALTDAIREGIQ